MRSAIYYLLALVAGACASKINAPWQVFITPLLMALMLVTFAELPIRLEKQSFHYRVMVGNFLVVPLIVAALLWSFRALFDAPAPVLLAAGVVLLSPWIM